MVFRKRRDRRSLQHQDQTAGSANLTTPTPEQPLLMQQTAPDLRLHKKTKKMSGLRRAILAVFCSKKSGSKSDTTKDTLAKPSDKDVENQRPTPDGKKSPASDHQILPSEELQKQVASDEKSAGQTTTLDELCEQAQLDASRDQPAVTGKASLQIDTTEDEKPSKLGALSSSASMDALSIMTSQQLQDYLAAVSAPIKDKQQLGAINDAKSSTDSAFSSGTSMDSSGTQPSQQPPNDQATLSTLPVTPAVVYHPHLGCRMYNRSDIKPAVVGRYGQPLGMVGEGAFAQVSVVRLPDGTLAAAKVLQSLNPEGSLWQEIIAVAAAGKHPSFTKLYGVVDQKPLRTMLYEFVGDKDTLSVTTLQDALDWSGTSSALSRKTWMRVVKNICEGLLHLHNSDYVHCDIKSDNILLYRANDGEKTRWQAKIIDLGNACLEVAGPWLRIPGHLIDQMYLECPQMAPEVIEGDTHFNKPAEVYALGDLLLNIGEAAGIRRLRKVGKRCQHVDSSKRPTMAEICKKMSKHWK